MEKSFCAVYFTKRFKNKHEHQKIKKKTAIEGFLC